MCDISPTSLQEGVVKHLGIRTETLFLLCLLARNNRARAEQVQCLQQEEELFYFLQHKLNITVDIGKVSGTDSTSCSVSGRLGQWILSF